MPLQIGDIVRHRIFGEGTIITEHDEETSHYFVTFDKWHAALYSHIIEKIRYPRVYCLEDHQLFLVKSIDPDYKRKAIYSKIKHLEETYNALQGLRQNAI